MKYMIIARPRRSHLRNATPDKLEKGRQMLETGRSRGIVEAVYTLVSGGSVWIVNAESHESLARGLRRHDITGSHDVEIHPIIEADKTLTAYSSRITEAHNAKRAKKGSKKQAP